MLFTFVTMCCLLVVVEIVTLQKAKKKKELIIYTIITIIVISISLLEYFNLISRHLLKSLSNFFV